MGMPQPVLLQGAKAPADFSSDPRAVIVCDRPGRHQEQMSEKATAAGQPRFADCLGPRVFP